MTFKGSSITTKLLLLFLLVGLASISLVGIYSFYAARDAIIQRTMDQLISVRAMKKQQIEYFFAEKTRNLEFLARSGDIQNVSSGNLNNFTWGSGFSNLYLVTDKDNQILIFRLNGHDTTTLHSAEIEKFKQIPGLISGHDSLVITDLFMRSAYDTVPVCLMGKRVSDKQGRNIGVLVLEISSAEINPILLHNNSRIGLGQSGEAYLTGRDLIMRSESRFIRHSVLRTRVNSLSAKLAAAGKTGAIETQDYRNIQVFSAYEPLKIPGLNWVILAEMDYAESLIPVRRIRNDIFLVSLIISVFILALARLISKMITQPIISLKNAALKTGQGDFSSKVDIKSTDEIGALAGTFNTMIDRIKEEREHRLSAMYDGQEMERQRVSRELHDGLGQKLVGAKLQLENCESQDLPCLQKTFREIRNVFGSLIEDTRQISSGLMPPALNELGLVNALENLCITSGRQTQISVEFSTNVTDGLPDGKTTVYLYRIAQEALNNAIRHSGADEINMHLTGNKENLILIIEDNGKGFDPERNGPGSGNGLYNMQERARILGGTFNAETGPGKGTTIRIKIPTLK